MPGCGPESQHERQVVGLGDGVGEMAIVLTRMCQMSWKGFGYGRDYIRLNFMEKSLRGW